MAQNTYIPKPEIKRLSKRSDLMGFWLTFHAWAVIVASIAMFIIWPNPLTFIAAVLIIGGRQLGLAILMHDGAHGLLFKNQKINALVGQYFLAHPVGANMPSYRKYHLVHHLNTQQDNDPDLQLSAPFPISRKSLTRKIFRDVTGLTGFKLRIGQIYMTFKHRKTPAVNGDQAFSFKNIIGPYLINIVLFLICFISGYWWVYFAFWLLPLFTVFQLFLRIRNIAEHAMTSRDNNPLQHARTTQANLLARIFVAPYWVNYHVEHHAYMYVPCWQLKALHKAMIREGHGPDMEIRNSYRDVLRLAAPAL
jgi:fatty acid desaturase